MAETEMEMTKTAALPFSVPYGSSFAQLLVRKSWPVMSGHEAMRSEREKGQSIFARNSGLLHIRTTAKFVVTIKIRTSLPDTTIMPFWSRSGHGQGQGQSQGHVSDLGYPLVSSYAVYVYMTGC